MNILILFVCAGLCVLSFKIDKKIYNPFFLFNFIWGVAVFVSGLGLFDFMVARASIYWLLLIAVIGFNIPLLIFHKKYKLLANAQSLVMQSDTSIVSKWTYRIVIFFQAILLLLSIKRSIIAVQWLAQGNPYERIRSFYYYSDSIVGSMAENLINIYLITPFLTFCMILFAISIFKKKINLPFVLLYLANLGMVTFYTGARGGIFDLIILCAVVLMIFFREVKKDRKRCTFLLCSAIISVILLVTITLVRSIHSKNIIYSVLKTITMYFTGSIKFLEINIDKFLGNYDYLWGRGFFGGVADVFVLLLRFIGFRNIDTAGTLIGTPVQKAELIGPNQTYNAFPTMIYTFLFDSGILGVFIDSILFGLLCAFTYYIMLKKNNIFLLGMYLLCVISIVDSILVWDFLSPWACFVWIGFGILYLLDQHFSVKGLSNLESHNSKLSIRCLVSKWLHRKRI